MADRVQIQQVILNLLVNAIEATKDSDGPREIAVAARPLDEHVQVSVSDTGRGLPAQDTARIFDAFYTTKREGTGMGLSVSRSIAESHGGRLSAHGNPDRGATFQLDLPMLAGSSSGGTASR